MEVIFTKEQVWLRKWDDFVLTENKASHLLLSSWSQSFSSYGFDYEMCIYKDGDNIHGGFAAVIAKALVFKFYIVPYGPIVSENFSSELNRLVSEAYNRAKNLNCCYAHITLPFSKTANKHVYNTLPELPALKNAISGHRFKYVYSSSGLNWVDFNSVANEDDLIDNFRPSVRRYIRSSQRKDLHEKVLLQHDDIKMGYDLCLENAKKNNYSLRSWDSFKETLLQMTGDGTAKFIGAFYNEELKGAALIVRSGNYYTYILGGTKKEKPDLLVGHFLHWKAIHRSYMENLSGYNISLGGSKGVVDLKNSYANDQIMFDEGKYYWIVKPMPFRLYQFFEKKLKPYKKNVSSMLAFIKSLKS